MSSNVIKIQAKKLNITANTWFRFTPPKLPGFTCCDLLKQDIEYDPIPEAGNFRYLRDVIRNLQLLVSI